jgi:hypothetical protein
MITDIYLKRENDPGYEELSFIEREELQVLLAQIKMTLLTPTKTVLGGSDYGVDEESFLFDFSDSVDLAGLEIGVRYQLKQYCSLLKNRNFEVKAYLVPDGIDQFKDSIHLLLTIDGKARFVIAYK